MAITIELDPELERRAHEEADVSAAGDVGRVVTDALVHYLALQEATRYLLANPPVDPKDAGMQDVGELGKQIQVDLEAVLRSLAGDSVDIEAIKQGKAKIPEDLARKLGHGKAGIDLVEILREVDPDALKQARKGSSSGDRPIDEEAVARALAASYVSTDTITSAAKGAARIAARVEEVRRDG